MRRTPFPRWVPGIAIASLAAVLVASCDSPSAPAPPEPGTLEVRFTTPHADDRAVLLRVRLPAGTVVSQFAVEAPGAEGYHRVSGDTLRVAVFGDLTSGTLVRFHVPDRRAVAGIQAAILEVAGADHALRSDLAGYALTVAR